MFHAKYLLTIRLLEIKGVMGRMAAKSVLHSFAIEYLSENRRVNNDAAISPVCCTILFKNKNIN